MTADPAGDGLNWYAYVGGDPVNRVDPSGLNCEELGASIAASGGNLTGCVDLPEGVTLAEAFAEEEKDGEFCLLDGNLVPQSLCDFIGRTPTSGNEQIGPSGRQNRVAQRWDQALERLSDGNDLLQRLSLRPGSPCAATFGMLQSAFGVSLAGLKTQVNNSNWNDATTSVELERDLYSQGTDAYNFWNSTSSNNTISDYFRRMPNVTAQSALAISGLSGNVYFRSSYVNRLSSQKTAALLAHEALHSLGFDDTQVQRTLGLATGAGTVNITTRLYNDCFK